MATNFLHLKLASILSDMKKILFLLLLCFNGLITNAQQKTSKKESQPKPFVLGVIEELESKVLHEKRTLNIYLPEGYNPKDTVRYPVIYLLDGSADEDFIHIVGLVQFNTFEWVAQLPKSIVVGIANVDRRRDFTFPSNVVSDQKNNPTSGHSDKFIEFIEKELQPFIDAKYKTTDTRTLIGQSLGGLLATEILFTKPNLFNKYVIVSPSLWWNNGSLLTIQPAILNADFSQETRVYIAVGKEGLTPTDPPRVMEVDANLLVDKLQGSASKALQVTFDYLPFENHATIMHQAVFNAFKFINQQ